MRISKFSASLAKYFFIAATAISSSYASAVVINFDDIERVHPDPDDNFWADQPITDQYLSQGLIINNGYLNSYDSWSEYFVSGPNYLQGGDYVSFSFVGKLPKYVSMFVTAPSKDVAYLGAWCADGSVIWEETPGWAGPDHDTPFKGKNLITFYSDAGISRINISSFYNLRTSAMIDDLTFLYEVPEPTPAFLLGFGLLALFGSRAKSSRKR